MRTLFNILLACLILLVPLKVLADDESSDVARIVSDQKIHEIDQKIRLLSKRINQGIKSGVLSKETAADLRSDVKTLWDKKKEFMDSNGAKVLDQDQLGKLKAMWKDISQKIYNAKHAAVSAIASGGSQ